MGMGYTVFIRDTTTGESREYLNDDFDWDDESSEYLWTDGNYGCDCNRSLFFARAIGTPEDKIDEAPCNPWPEPNRFKVKIMVGDEVVLDEEEE